MENGKQMEKKTCIPNNVVQSEASFTLAKDGNMSNYWQQKKKNIGMQYDTH
jgi:hypothetical protein